MSEIDWNKEKEALRKGETKDWWKPTPGQHKIRILSEGEEYVVQWEEKDIQKVRFDVEVAGKQLNWGVSKGLTENSLYGQIVLVMVGNQGKLPVEVNVVVKGIKKDTSYTILEALPLMTAKEEKVEGA